MNLIELVRKKCWKDKSLQEIADELEERVRDIEMIYQLVRENPEKDEKDILKMIEGEMKN